MFLEGLSVEFSAASFRTLNELIFVFQTFTRLFDCLLLNFLLLVTFDGDGMLLYFIGWGFIVIGGGFDLFFGLRLGL